MHLKSAVPIVCSLLALSACSRRDPGAPQSSATAKPPMIGVSFETLQTEFWIAGFDAVRAELKRRNVAVADAVAEGDGAKQVEQVKELLRRGVDGLVVVPKDATIAVTLAEAAAAAQVPIVFFNRHAAPIGARFSAVVPDNLSLSRATAEYLCGLARQDGARRKAAILVGDLGDRNALERRDGFEQAMKGCDLVRVVARIETSWNADKAAAGLRQALKAHPDLGLIFSSSDFMLPAVSRELQAAGRWKKAGEKGHVILGGFDGDATAYRQLEEGYLDATGVQDVFFESQAAADAVLDLRAGRPVPQQILDKGFVIHAGNRAELAPRMWGARLLQRSGGAPR